MAAGGAAPSGFPVSVSEQDEAKRGQGEANYRLTDKYRRCWNCGNFRLPSACALVEGSILADHTCDLWAEEGWGGKKGRSGFRAGRRKYQDKAWAGGEADAELAPAEPPLDPGTYLCLGCADDWSLTSHSSVLPSCPSCGGSRWLAL